MTHCIIMGLLATAAALQHPDAGPGGHYIAPQTHHYYAPPSRQPEVTRAQRLETLEPDAEFIAEQAPAAAAVPPPGQLFYIIHPSLLHAYKPPLYIITNAPHHHGYQQPVMLHQPGPQLYHHQPPVHAYVGPLPPTMPAALALSQHVAVEETPRQAADKPQTPPPAHNKNNKKTTN